MNRVNQLLNQKNHYLENFYSLNEAELISFSENNFTNLENFYSQREEILKIIQYIDNEMNLVSDEVSKTLDDNSKREILSQLKIKDEYVSRILAQDLEILACIESAKSSIIKELQEVKRAKNVVNKYRSPSFDKKINEEV
jgi:hypothetical protein